MGSTTKILLKDSMKICRLCGKEQKSETISMFERSDANASDLKKEISFFLPIQVLETSPFPRGICEQCHNDFGVVSSFFVNLNEGQARLADILRKNENIHINMPDWISEKRTLFLSIYPAFEEEELKEEKKKKKKRKKKKRVVKNSRTQDTSNKSVKNATNSAKECKEKAAFEQGASKDKSTENQLEKSLEEIFKDDDTENKNQNSSSGGRRRTRKLPKRLGSFREKNRADIIKQLGRRPSQETISLYTRKNSQASNGDRRSESPEKRLSEERKSPSVERDGLSSASKQFMIDRRSIEASTDILNTIQEERTKSPSDAGDNSGSRKDSSESDSTNSNTTVGQRLVDRRKFPFNRPIGNDNWDDRNRTELHVTVKRRVILNESSSKSSEPGNRQSILGLNLTSTSSKNDESPIEEAHVIINKRVIIKEGSSVNKELDDWQTILGLNVAANTSTSTSGEADEDNSQETVEAKRNVATRDDTTEKRDFDTSEKIHEQNLFKDNGIKGKTRRGFLKNAEVGADFGIATHDIAKGVKSALKGGANAAERNALNAEAFITPEAMSEFSGYGDIIAMMFPKELQVLASFTISYAIFAIFKAVFDIQAVFKFDVKGIQLGQIIHEINVLNKKVDALLDAKMRSAMSQLPKAIEYLKSKDTHINAYEELEDILRKVEEAYSTVQDFEKKVFCKRTAIFARFMRDTYDKDRKEFTTLSSLQWSKKEIISSNMWKDVRELLDAFQQANSTRNIFKKMQWNKWTLKKQANQDLIDKVLKFSTPITLHYDDDLKRMEEKDILRYIPEGIDDGAILKLDENIVIKVWKHRTEDNDFELKWQPTIVDVITAHANNCSDEISFGEQMLPISHSSLVFFDVNHDSNKFLMDIFKMEMEWPEMDHGSKRNCFHSTLTSTFHKIDKKIEEVCKKNVDPFSSNLKHIMSQVSKAIQSLEEVQNFPIAFKSFQSAATILNEFTKNFPTSEDKFSIHQLSMFIDFMMAIYDEESKKFVPLGALEENKKDNFASKVFDRVSEILKEFEKLRLKKGSNLAKQEMLIHIMKFTLPIMWHYKMDCIPFSDVLEFVPEGVENFAELVFKDNIRINIWKYEESKDPKKRKFKLQWCPSFLFETTGSSKYTWMNLKNCASMWVDVCKKNMCGIEPWNMTSITSMIHYVDEMSKPK